MANRDDLLNLEGKKNVKKPLIYGAIAFLVFIIGVLGFAIYSNTQKKDENVVLPPQIKQEKQESMFKTVPIEEENTAKKEENKTDLAQKLLKNEQNVKKEEPKTVSEKKQEPKPEPKEEVTKPKQNTATKQAEKNEPKTSKNGSYYVQVAALLKYKKPNKKFLSLIEKEGYKYRLLHTYYVKNGKKIEVTKILIGPFETKTKAKKELKNIKNNITQNAFLFKVK